MTGDAAPPRDRANALLLAAWIEASTGHLDPARHHVTAASDLAQAIHDPDLLARCSYYLAYVISHHGEFRTALELTDRSQAIYDTLDRPWDQAANALFAARAAISAGDEARSVEAAERVQRWLREVEDPWLHVRGEAVLGELARLQHRFDDAVAPPRPRGRHGHDSSASSRPRPTRSRAWVEPSARPATTTPAPPPWSSPSTRPRPPAMCASRHWGGCTWVAS